MLFFCYKYIHYYVQNDITDTKKRWTKILSEMRMWRTGERRQNEQEMSVCTTNIEKKTQISSSNAKSLWIWDVWRKIEIRTLANIRNVPIQCIKTTPLVSKKFDSMGFKKKNSNNSRWLGIAIINWTIPFINNPLYPGNKFLTPS